MTGATSEGIAAELRIVIERGDYAAGRVLRPSLGELARTYRANRKTVRKALLALAGEGRVLAVEGGRYFVPPEGWAPADVIAHAKKLRGGT